MTPQTFATVAARLVGVVLLLQAAMLLPSLYTMSTLPRLAEPSFETKVSPDSPAYESAKHATERAKESFERTQATMQATMRRTRFPMYFSLGLHVIAGLIFVFYSREIGGMLCRGLDRKS